MSIPSPTWPDEPSGPSGPTGASGPDGEPGEPGVCELCGSRLGAGQQRCGTCGMVVGVAKPAPSPFSHGLLWAVGAGVLVIYLLVLALAGALR